MLTFFRNICAALAAILHTLTGHPLTKAEEALKQAHKDVCRRAANTQFHVHMGNYHFKRAQALDPQIDWRQFATEMDAYTEYRDDHRLEVRKHAEAQQRLAACEERVAKLKERYP